MNLSVISRQGVVCQADRVQPQWPLCGWLVVTGRHVETVCLCLWLGPTSPLNYSPPANLYHTGLKWKSADKRQEICVERVAQRGQSVKQRRANLKTWVCIDREAATCPPRLQETDPQLCIFTCRSSPNGPGCRSVIRSLGQAETKQNRLKVCVVIQASFKAKDLCLGVLTNITGIRLIEPEQRLPHLQELFHLLHHLSFHPSLLVFFSNLAPQLCFLVHFIRAQTCKTQVADGHKLGLSSLHSLLRFNASEVKKSWFINNQVTRAGNNLQAHRSASIPAQSY